MGIRVGAVSYLNTKPLIYDLQNYLPEADLSLDLPSRLADQLATEQLDVALVPSVEFLRHPEWSIVSDACIACRGPVRSVRLLFRTPPSEVRRLALDEGSRTSAALAQVLLASQFDIRPELVKLPIDDDYTAIDADACVVIGDRAMQIEGNGFHADWDLGQQWSQLTGLPFVFAMWVAKSPVSPDIGLALQSARDAGLQNVDRISASCGPQYALSVNDCRQYFLDHLYFHLGDRELKSLKLFQQQAAALGLVPHSTKDLNLQTT